MFVITISIFFTFQKEILETIEEGGENKEAVITNCDTTTENASGVYEPLEHHKEDDLEEKDKDDDEDNEEEADEDLEDREKVEDHEIKEEMADKEDEEEPEFPDTDVKIEVNR